MITAVSVNKRIILTIIVLLVLAGLGLWFLSKKDQPQVQLAPEERLQFKLERLDLALTAPDSLDEKQIAQLKAQYGEMFDTYVENILSLCSASDPALPYHLNNFLRDPYIDTLFRDVKSAYSETGSIEKELSDALSRFYHFFPKAPQYRMLGMVGAFQYKHALTDSGLLFGLDLHLGRDYRFYPKVRFLNNYMLPRLEASYLVVDGIELLVDDLTPAIAKEQLYEEIIRAGKIIYITQKCMPQLADSILLGFSSAQTQWAFENERNMWEYLINGDLLFSSDPKVISRFMSEGPFTPGLPDGCPARMAAFTGWRLVERYMYKYPETSLDALLQEPAEVMLKKSGYKGKS